MVSSGARDESTSSVNSLKHLELVDYLEADSRPTFAFDLTAVSQDPSSGLCISFANHAFRDIEAHASSDDAASLSELLHPSDLDTTAFVRWAKTSPPAELFEYRGSVWKATTVHKVWRIISSAGGLYDRKSATGKDSMFFGDSEDELAQDGPRSSKLKRKRSKGVEMFDLLEASGSVSAEHCRYVRDFPWADTTVGPIASWPQTLIQAIPFLLCNPEACCIFWSPDRTIIFNDSYVNLIHDLIAKAMGTSARVLFGDAVWDPVEQDMLEVERTKRGLKREAVCIFVDRSRGMEETFFNYNFMPLFDSAGQVSGIFNHCIEVTSQVVAQRQLNTLISVGKFTASMASLNDFWHGMFEAMEGCAADIPFAGVYSLDGESLLTESMSGSSSKGPEAEKLNLAGSVGFPTNHPALSDTLDITSNSGLAPVLRRVLPKEALLVHKTDGSLPESFFLNCHQRGAVSEFSELLIVPLAVSTDRIAAYLILGINPLRPYDDEYKRFINLLTRQVEDAATSVILIQKEKQQAQRQIYQAELQRKWLSAQLEQQTREARESELRFYNFAKQAPVGVYILGPGGEIKFCNDAWYKLLGVPFDTSGPNPWEPHVHPDDAAAVQEQWQLLMQGRPQSNFEWRAIPNQGSGGVNEQNIVYLRSSAFPELADDGSFKTVTGLLMDVSVHKAHEKAVADRLTNALEAKRAQENFMDMVSHEMRNPLNAMLQCAEEASYAVKSIGIAETPKKNQLELAANALEAIETIRYCGVHQKHIIDDVLTISKLDSNLITLSPTEATPTSVVDQAIRIFISEIRAANIEVSRKGFSEGTSAPCLMDSGRVLQILINLVGNAVKFLSNRPIRKLNLTIATSKDRPTPSKIRFVPSGRKRRQSSRPVDWGPGSPFFVYFSVEDTGPGLSRDEMDTLFARFMQASPRTHSQYGGSGLGLFISRELAEMHGGEIGLSSEVNRGSTFAFYIECRTPDERPSADLNPASTNIRSPLGPRNPSLSTARTPIPMADISILIVEDNVINQKVLTRQLGKLGYKTCTAKHGQEALDMVERSCWRTNNKSPDAMAMSVILSDLEMPVMDGLAFVREVRKRQRDGVLAESIPMIAVTGNARAEQVNTAREAGFSEIVCKPYSVQDLVPIIARLVRE